MRPDVPGTVARGESNYDMDFMTGVQMDQLSMMDAPRADRLVRLSLGPIGPADDEAGDDENQNEETRDESTAAPRRAAPKRRRTQLLG